MPKEYSVEHLSPTQTAMLEDLRDYGIIWQRKVGTFTNVLMQRSSLLMISGLLEAILPDASCHNLDVFFSPAAICGRRGN